MPEASPASVGPDPVPGQEPPARPWLRVHLRLIVSTAVLVAVVASVAIAVSNERRAFSASLSRMGVLALLASVGFGLLGTASSLPTWRTVMAGLGARFEWSEAARVFYITQLGKYLPGSVWPTVLQMDAAQRRGFSRRTIISGNLVVLAISCTVGLLISSLTLSLYDSAALARYWWGLLAVPVLLVALHPRTLPMLTDKALALLKRPPLEGRLAARSELIACGWAVLTWLGLGGQLVALVAAERPLHFSLVMLCLGAIALAVPLGILFIPAPAGAGVREAVLVLVLGSVMTTGQSLAVIVASRAVLIACDVIPALIVLVLPRRKSVPAAAQ